MRQVDVLDACDQGSVWRCNDCAIAWIDGAWHRLAAGRWIPLRDGYTPAGPFYEIENPDFSDYREHTLRGRAELAHARAGQ